METEELSAALFGKSRRAVLALFFSRGDKEFYVREVVRMTGVGQGAAQRELQRLSAAGIIRRRVRGRQVYYQANLECPIFPELKGLMIKTAGVGEVLRRALKPLASRIQVAFVFGSLAQGNERRGSDVDLLVVGNTTFGEVVAAVSPAQQGIGREINPSVYPPPEFGSKLASGDHFLTSVSKAKKMFLIGDEHELARLAPKRLAR